jgi:hypothetical protein
MFSWRRSHLVDHCLSALFKRLSSQLYCCNLICIIKMDISEHSQSVDRYINKIRSTNAIKIQIKKLQVNRWGSTLAKCKDIAPHNLTAALGGSEGSASLRCPFTSGEIGLITGVSSDMGAKWKTYVLQGIQPRFSPVPSLVSILTDLTVYSNK